VTTPKRLIVSILFLFFFGCIGCSLGPSSLLEPKPQLPETVPGKVTTESNQLGKDQKKILEGLEKTPPREIQVKPLMPAYNPLEDHMVSFSVIDEDVRLVLYSLAQSVGMNIIMDPSLTEEKRLITLHFDKVSAATVLREVLKSYDLYYEIDQNVIRIRPYEERFFTLNFMDTNMDMSLDVGGDVLGAGETESATGLSGSFKLSGKAAKKGNAYDLLETMVQKMMSKGGKYSINRLSGSLYIKDTPTVIHAVSRLINHLKEMLSRQILIEARIIEVALSKDYSYGIDWSLLRQEISNGTRVNSASWALGRGLVVSGVSKSFSVDTTLNALRTFGDTKIVSNPSIRCRHGKPAIISVGTSITYKKSVDTTTTTGISENLQSSSVEVSTVFDGLILGIIPFIEGDGNIILLINPIKSDVDPASIEAVPISDKSTDSISLPKVGIKEISTTIGVKSGDVVFLGGLIDKNKKKENKGVPILSGIPVFGYLFKNESSRSETRELVIALKVLVI